MSVTVYLAWVSVIIFFIMALYRFKQYSSYPLFLRWELYPVPTEPRHHYGGSYMEEVDYNKKPRHHQRIGGLLDMGSEVFLLKKVKEHNRFGLWPFSFSMHWGLYLLAVWVVLLLVEAIFKLEFLAPITNFIGPLSFILGAFGSVGLFFKRVGTQNLAAYTTPEDYFNLLFIFAIFLTGIISWSGDTAFVYTKAYINEVISFKPVPEPIPFIVLLNFTLFWLFVIYMPFCKLFHYLAKYFTFDKIFWDDGFLVKGSANDQKVLKQLGYTCNWEGPHVVPGKTWLENAMIVERSEAK
ncbi:MAG: respiratory nitrate reductase subunit gamma [Bacillota bacterium]